MENRIHFLTFVLTCVSLLFWGWQTQVLWLGFLLVSVLTFTFTIKGKYSFDTSSFFQIADLCALIAIAIFAFLWIDDRASKAVYPTLRLLPVALLPLLLIQLLNKKQQVPVSALMFLKRKLPTRWFDFTPFFIIACLFAAAASEKQHIGFFIGSTLILILWLLVYHHHVRTATKLKMVLMLLSASALALVMQWGILGLQERLEMSIHQWIQNRVNASQASTAIGAVGRVKLSDDIVFRVKTYQPVQLPVLLRQVSYPIYKDGMWFGSGWSEVTVPLKEAVWQFQPSKQEESSVQLQSSTQTDIPPQSRSEPYMRIFQSFSKADSSLALPDQTSAIAQLPVDAVKIMQGGSVRASGLPPFVAFDVFTDESESMQDMFKEANPKDLKIPKTEAKAVAQVARDLNLYQLRFDQGDAAVLKVLQQYFFNEYRYSTWLNAPETAHSPLSEFLLHSHSGHCEYFATATVLLLREVGIPARYVLGYSMQEWDESQSLYLVRGRDAHAWVMAQVNGSWVNVDNTPPNWYELEDEGRGLFQDFKDLLSDLGFEFKKWRYAESDDDNTLSLVLVLVMFSFLAWRVLRRVKTEAQVGPLSVTEKESFASSWLLLEQDLEGGGFARLKGESLTGWLQRIQKTELLPLVQLYYLQRFGGKTLDEKQLRYFEKTVAAYRAQFRAEHKPES